MGNPLHRNGDLPEDSFRRFWTGFGFLVVVLLAIGGWQRGNTLGTFLVFLGGFLAISGIAVNAFRLLPVAGGGWLGLVLLSIGSELWGITHCASPEGSLCIAVGIGGLVLYLIYFPRAPSKFVLWLSGTVVEALQMASADLDEREAVGYGFQMAMGAAILVTASFAVLSMGIATKYILPESSRAFAAVAWGALILTFDRVMLKQLRPIDPTKGDTGLSVAFNITIRISLALLVGFVVSVPLEMSVAEKQIDSYVREQMVKDATANRALIADAYASRIKVLNEGLNSLDGQEKHLSEVLGAANIAFDKAIERERELFKQTDEHSSHPINGQERINQKKIWHQPVVTAQEQYKIADEKLKTFRGSLYTKQLDYSKAIKTLQTEIDNLSPHIKTIDPTKVSFFDRYEAYEQINRPGAIALKWGLRIFLVFVELMPVLLKLLSLFSKAQSYDEALRTYQEKERILLSSRIQPWLIKEDEEKKATFLRAHDINMVSAQIKQIETETEAHHSASTAVIQQKNADLLRRAKAFAEQTLKDDLERQERILTAQAFKDYSALLIQTATTQNNARLEILENQARSIQAVNASIDQATQNMMANHMANSDDWHNLFWQDQVLGEFDQQRRQQIESIIESNNKLFESLRTKLDPEGEKNV